MKLISMRCEYCGADLKLDPDCKTAACPYCGAKVLIDNGPVTRGSGGEAASEETQTHAKDVEVRLKEAELRLKELEYRHEREMLDLEQRTREKKNWKRLVLAYFLALIIFGFLDREMNVFVYILIFGGIALAVLRPRGRDLPGAGENESGKNKWVAFILCFFLGTFGGHYFYVGRPGMGILYLFTFGIGGIGWLIDLLRIACGTFRDRDGFYLKS